ncbi:hypothetical protein CcaverHIS002_0701530 [Cutaneotrichosporon cavernicola]|uniref:Phenylalanine--tRNA ligase, mitochondrial n=1 Tax=Cutaneotrichosporon cavernicola TaxID=279322 RepID=A0AA48L9U7_9TREE|nr:uncharacterized protein CcaverHIS019_0701560 [Cutaneotrichosporon cavernicola]BEI86807.1 hypothetical protein CcaverHIS002_0701530 [Cutaneotrichosporon cavernicola]BEI94584.1 hypothetical protein CcaverHIS019_0701560 [Cutaneotrichosporon cavernicola]BEJ02361.1 hypothetical protein CcaverHIS631_0701560 [Cutaneotrichosporon cavernicola]BEJ10118.1 hypothetical protein CcaverHIS641_0701530 [Cutaneotrichosporon cavernicola]
MLLTQLPRAVASSSRLASRAVRIAPRASLTARVALPTLSFAQRRFQATSADTLTIRGDTYPVDAKTNTPINILGKVERQLHMQEGHPLSTLREIIESHFKDYVKLRPSTPVVSVHQNFDELGFPADHPGRAETDSYYVNGTHMLRTHTSAHEVEAYKTDENAFLIAADVYRRDEIDSSHYPVFHQMEGMRCFSGEQGLDFIKADNARLAAELEKCPIIIEDDTVVGPSNPYQECHDPELATEIMKNLKHSLNGMIFKLFGGSTGDEPLKVRWIEAQFPWTSPSFEVEVWFNGEWLEILGCGVVVQKTLETAGMGHKSAWAFGLGLERIAMVLFDIPDIRLFWSTDPRFLDQFADGKITTFKAYSKYPPCYKDMSFWLPDDAASKDITPWHENDYCEIVRDIAGDLVENVKLIDDFTHPKTGRRSLCYRLNYRSMDRSLSNDEVNVLQDKVTGRVVDQMGIEMR